MRAKAKLVRSQYSHYGSTELVLDESAFAACCETMDDAVDDGVVLFKNDYGDDHIQSLPCFVIENHTFGYYAGEHDVTYWQIKFCPFCGAKIELEIESGVS